MESRTAPSFELISAAGESVSLTEVLNSGRYAVVFFYPKDDTPGCTAQACGFRDEYTAFAEAGAEVIGISMDAQASHQAFAEKHQLPFTLLSDPGGIVAQSFGVKKTMGLIPGRETFVIAPSGEIIHRFSSQFNPRRHIKEALKILRPLN